MYHTDLDASSRAKLGRNMNSERVWKHFLLAFLLALVGYLDFYGRSSIDAPERGRGK